METMKRTNKAFAMLLMGAALATSACGDMKTNPLEEYSEIANEAVPVAEKKIDSQEFLSSEFYRIETSGALNFVQGKSTSYFIKPRLFMTGVDWELTACKKPEGATLVKATDAAHKGQYVLSWTPPKGTLAPQDPKRIVEFEFCMNVISVSKPEDAELLKLIGHPRLIPAFVIRTDEQPQVQKVTSVNGTDTLDIGESMTFSVIVKDLGAPDERPPHLVAENENNKSNEHVKLNVAKNVQIVSEPKALGDGRFEFTAVLNTEGMTMPSKLPMVAARFVLVVVSRSGLPAVDYIVEVKVKRKGAATGGAQ